MTFAQTQNGKQIKRVLMKREPNSRVTYCQTAAISPRAAKAQRGKTQRDRAATKRDMGGRESEGWRQRCERSRAEWSVETDCR